jgi:hypothetical protein
VKKQRFGNVVCADIGRDKVDTRGGGTDMRDVGRMLKRYFVPFPLFLFLSLSPSHPLTFPSYFLHLTSISTSTSPPPHLHLTSTSPPPHLHLLQSNYITNYKKIYQLRKRIHLLHQHQSRRVGKGTRRRSRRDGGRGGGRGERVDGAGIWNAGR